MAGEKSEKSKLINVNTVTNDDFCTIQQRDGVEVVLEGSFGKEKVLKTIDGLELKV